MPHATTITTDTRGRHARRSLEMGTHKRQPPKYPPGGDQYQVLQKTDDADYKVDWGWLRVTVPAV